MSPHKRLPFFCAAVALSVPPFSICSFCPPPPPPSAFVRPPPQHSNVASPRESATADEGDLPPTLPPGRARWPVVGDTLRLLNPRTMASYQVDSRSAYGPIWKTSVLFRRAVFVTGAANLDELAREEARKSTSASFPPHHQKLFGPRSLLVTSGTEHDRVRRLMQPALSPASVMRYEPSIAAAVSEFLSECRDQSSGVGVAFPLADSLRKFTVYVSLRVLLGYRDAPRDEEVNSLITDINTWSRGLLSAPTTFLPWTVAGRAVRARKRIADRFRGWIDEERERESEATSSENHFEETASLLGKLVHSRVGDGGEGGLSDDDIIDNVLTLIFAGSDTTASVLTSAFMELSLHPTLEERLREACSSQGCDNEATELLKAFLSETQRAHPAGPFTMRIVDEEDLCVGGYYVPRGWLVVYALAGTLLGDDEVYPLPGSFDVDRWTTASDPPPVWAFGGGKRKCPGMFLSIAESVILLKAVLGPKAFRWRLAPDQDLSYRYTPGLFPVDGLMIELYEDS